MGYCHNFSSAFKVDVIWDIVMKVLSTLLRAMVR